MREHPPFPKWDDIHLRTGKKILWMKDHHLAILLLTTMNNQNQKNKRKGSGYHVSLGLELTEVLGKMILRKSLSQIGHSMPLFWGEIQASLYRDLHSLTLQNGPYDPSTLLAFPSFLLKKTGPEGYLGAIYRELSPPSKELLESKEEVKKELGDRVPAAVSKLSLLLQFKDQKSMEAHLSQKIGSLAGRAFGLGWMLGGGEVADLFFMEELGKHFGIFYQLAIDFKVFEKHLSRLKTYYSFNYVINFGIQEAYRLFMVEKQKVLKLCLEKDILTTTLEELIKLIQKRVDHILRDPEDSYLGSQEDESSSIDSSIIDS